MVFLIFPNLLLMSFEGRWQQRKKHEGEEMIIRNQKQEYAGLKEG